MKKAILLLLSIQLCLPTFGQVPYHKQKINVNRWYNSIQADSLPKGSREKTIYFPKHNYRIIGQFHKGILTAGHIVTIYDTENDDFLLLRGKVSYQGNNLFVKGVKNYKAGQGICQTYGTFFLSNTPDYQMQYKPRRASELVVADSDIYYYCGYYLNSPTIVALNYFFPTISIDGETGGEEYSDFSSRFDKSKIMQIGYDKPYELMLTVGNYSYLSWDTGVTFKGDIHPVKSDKGSIHLITKAGIKNGFKEGHKTIRVIEDGLELSMELIDDPNNPLICFHLCTK